MRISRASLLGMLVLTSGHAFAGYFEISGNGAFSRYDNGLVGNVNSTSTTQRWGGGLAYRFLTNTAIELSYMDSKSTDRFGQQDDFTGYDYDLTKVTQVQNVSLDLVLDFAGKGSRFRPYIRGGGGYMTRKVQITGTRTERISGVISDLAVTNPVYYSASATGGLGLKLFIAQSVALEGAFNVYITDLNKPEIYVHYSATAGLRFLF